MVLPITQETEEHYLDYDLLRDCMKYMTVAQVAHYLTYIFDCGTHEVMWGDTVTCPAELGSASAVSDCIASTIRVWFWGGPPGEADWYQGDFLTLLIDKLYYCAAAEYTDVIEKFLETFYANKTRQIDQEVAVGA